MGPGEPPPGDHSYASFDCPRCGCARLVTRPRGRPQWLYECDQCGHLFGAPQPPAPKPPDPAIPASKLREVVTELRSEVDRLDGAIANEGDDRAIDALDAERAALLFCIASLESLLLESE